MPMSHTDFARAASGLLADLGFDAYRDEDLAGLKASQCALFEVVEGILVTLPRPQREEIMDRLLDHLANEQTRLRFYDGVSVARADRDLSWEQEFRDTYSRSCNVGAVHLELGVWTAFPDSRRQQMIERDGLAEFIRLDFDSQYELDVVADAQALPFADESIDRISADSVLEHLPYPHRVIEECHRVLRPGGMVCIITPWVFNLHGYPDDYLRYAPSFYEHVCGKAGFDVVRTDVDSSRGLYYTLHNSAKTAIIDPSDPAAAALRTLHLLVIGLLGTLVPLDNQFHNGARHWFHSVRLLAVKAGEYIPSERHPPPETPFLCRALDLLADPESKQSLVLKGDRLVCRDRARAYPVLDGIPHFTKPEQTGHSRGDVLTRLFRGWPRRYG